MRKKRPRRPGCGGLDDAAETQNGDSAMVPYKNLSGDSGVVEYEIGSDFIKVRFKKFKTIYVWDYSTPGVRHVEAMKRLAVEGRGLSTYIAQEVREDYARKE